MNTIKKYINYYKYLIVNAFVVFIILEMTVRKNILEVFKWGIQSPIYMLVNISFILLVFVFLYACTNKIFSHIIGNSIFILISCVNYFKFDIRKSVFIPNDFTLVDELIGIWQNIFNKKMMILLGSGLFLYALTLFVLFKIIDKSHLKLNFRVKKMIPTFLVLVIIVMFSHSQSHSQEGYFYYFVSNISVENDLQVKNVQKENQVIDQFMSKHESDKISEQQEKANASGEYSNTTDQVKPNIIVIMNEAFWNPKLLDGVEFTDNPVSNYEKFSKEGMSGFLLAPVFSGGTCNSEFQVLTGINSRFYANKPLMYNEKVNNPVMTMASVLRKQGYVSTAIHPHTNWYYQRNYIYEQFGFDRFLSKEFLLGPTYKGFYISDQTCNKEILNTMNNTKEPDFIYAITMQNHGPYDDDRYMYADKIDVNVKNAADAESEQMINSYVQGIYDADKALGDLLTELKNSNEETIVLFFGDHLPYLGKGNKVYEEYGFRLDSMNMTLEKQIPYYSVPFLVWSNYETDLASQQVPLMNMNYLAPTLLDAANLKMPKYYQFLLDVKEKYPVISDNWVLDDSGKEVTDANLDDYNELYDIYKTYQNMVLTNQTTEADKKWVIEDNETFNSFYSEIRVNEIKMSGDTLVIKADNFYKSMTLKVDGNKTNFNWIDNKEIQIPNFLADYNQTEIEILLIDEKGNEIAAWRNK